VTYSHPSRRIESSFDPEIMSEFLGAKYDSALLKDWGSPVQDHQLLGQGGYNTADKTESYVSSSLFFESNFSDQLLKADTANVAQSAQSLQQTGSSLPNPNLAQPHAPQPVSPQTWQHTGYPPLPQQNQWYQPPPQGYPPPLQQQQQQQQHVASPGGGYQQVQAQQGYSSPQQQQQQGIQDSPSKGVTAQPSNTDPVSAQATSFQNPPPSVPNAHPYPAHPAYSAPNASPYMPQGYPPHQQHVPQPTGGYQAPPTTGYPPQQAPPTTAAGYYPPPQGYPPQQAPPPGGYPYPPYGYHYPPPQGYPPPQWYPPPQGYPSHQVPPTTGHQVPPPQGYPHQQGAQAQQPTTDPLTQPSTQGPPPQGYPSHQAPPTTGYPPHQAPPPGGYPYPPYGYPPYGYPAPYPYPPYGYSYPPPSHGYPYPYNLPPQAAPVVPPQPNTNPASPQQVQVPAQPIPVQQEPIKQEPIKQEPARQEPERQEPARQEPERQEPARQEPEQKLPTPQEPASQTPIKQVPIQQVPLDQTPPKMSSERESFYQTPSQQTPSQRPSSNFGSSPSPSPPPSSNFKSRSDAIPEPFEQAFSDDEEESYGSEYSASTASTASLDFDLPFLDNAKQYLISYCGSYGQAPIIEFLTRGPDHRKEFKAMVTIPMENRDPFTTESPFMKTKKDAEKRALGLAYVQLTEGVHESTIKEGPGQIISRIKEVQNYCVKYFNGIMPTVETETKGPHHLPEFFTTITIDHHKEIFQGKGRGSTKKRC